MVDYLTSWIVQSCVIKADGYGRSFGSIRAVTGISWTSGVPYTGLRTGLDSK